MLRSESPMRTIVCLVAVTLCTIAGCSRPLPGDDQEEPTAPAVHPLALPEQLSAVNAGYSVEIQIADRPVDSFELETIGQATGLKTLILDQGVVTDDDVTALRTLNQLEHLRLRESPLSDVGLAKLASFDLKRLVVLNLPQAQPTARGLKELGKLQNVRQLRIGGRQIDDEAVKVLAEWPSLSSLHLIQPSLTDAALETIASMKDLSSFYIDECPLSDAAWEKLLQARRDLHVHIDQAHGDLRSSQTNH